jgi:predicted DNA-binding transcriptional regulator AlpA
MKPHPVPKKLHIDRRAHEVRLDGNGDELLSTVGAAAMLGVSTQWMCKARSLGYGPRWVKLSARRIRYLRSEIFRWLQERTHAHTKEYTEPRRNRQVKSVA